MQENAVILTQSSEENIPEAELIEELISFFVRHPARVFEVAFNLFEFPFPVNSATHKIQHFRVDELAVDEQAKPEKKQSYSVEIKVKDNDLV